MKRLLVVLVLIVLAPSAGWSLPTTMEFGVRGAFDDYVLDDTELNEHYSAAELYYLKNLPWEKEISPACHILTRLDLGAIYLHSGTDDGGLIAAGGDVVLRLADGLLDIEAGWRPAVLFKHKYGEDDFGGPLQSASHAGLTFNLYGIVLSYRFQHISNGGLYELNPGLDMHVIGVGKRY